MPHNFSELSAKWIPYCTWVLIISGDKICFNDIDMYLFWYELDDLSVLLSRQWQGLTIMFKQPNFGYGYNDEATIRESSVFTSIH